jgi:hypothetical protein
MGRQELAGIALLVNGSRFTPSRPMTQCRVRLDREAVEGDMLGLERERLLQVTGPIAFLGSG